MFKQHEIDIGKQQHNKNIKKDFMKEQYSVRQFEKDKYFIFLKSKLSDYLNKFNIKYDTFSLCRNTNIEDLLDVLMYIFKDNKDDIFNYLNDIIYLFFKEYKISYIKPFKKSFNNYIINEKNMILLNILKQFLKSELTKVKEQEYYFEMFIPNDFDDIDYDHIIKKVLKKNNYNIYDVEYLKFIFQNKLRDGLLHECEITGFIQDYFNKNFDKINFGVPLKEKDKHKLLLKNKK